jgi:O-antigen/teichoic acid export membrane protein
MSLKANIIANYCGQGWRALMSLAFVPVYINLLGMEAYGVIGLFATLQAWLGFFDMGLRPVLNREMARFTAGAHDGQSIANLLRSTELLALLIALVFGVVVWAGSDWLATDWVHATKLSTATIAQAFALMGLVAAMQFIESLYASAISGLQRQVLQNVISSFVATFRALGAVGVLIWISPTILGFFVWQGIASLISVILLACAVYRTLPRPAVTARFSWDALRKVRAYAGGMVGIAVLSLLLMQVDKILLSKQLPLDQLGHYLLAGVVAGSMSILATPIGAAYFPRFTELVARGDEPNLREAFHHGAQLTAVPLAAAGAMLILFGDRVLALWTQDAALSREVAPLLSLIALGTMFNGLMSVPYILQLAHGWTSLAIKINIVAVLVLVPAILLLVPHFGPIAAAIAWATLNVSYVLIGAHLMFVRLLRTEKWSWYFEDIALPLGAAFVVGYALRLVLPTDHRFVFELAYLVTAGMCIVSVAAISSPLIRAELRQRIFARLRPRTI